MAAACREIARDPLTVADYRARGNLVAVISNGTAVLGLGAIGALASKPVMEGKAVLFKQFADIDVFDIEVDERHPQAFILERAIRPQMNAKKRDLTITYRSRPDHLPGAENVLGNPLNHWP